MMRTRSPRSVVTTYRMRSRGYIASVTAWGSEIPRDVGALQTPTLPFAESTASAGVVPVPELTGMEVVSLRVELMLQPVSREETRWRYRVPTEAVVRVLEVR